MAARLHALDDDGIGALFLDALCELHARHDGNDLDPCRMELLKVRNGVACPERDERRFLLADYIHDLFLVGRHEHDVDPERPIRQAAAAANLITRILRRAAAG